MTVKPWNKRISRTVEKGEVFYFQFSQLTNERSHGAGCSVDHADFTCFRFTETKAEESRQAIEEIRELKSKVSPGPTQACQELRVWQKAKDRSNQKEWVEDPFRPWISNAFASHLQPEQGCPMGTVHSVSWSPCEESISMDTTPSVRITHFKQASPNIVLCSPIGSPCILQRNRSITSLLSDHRHERTACMDQRSDKPIHRAPLVNGNKGNVRNAVNEIYRPFLDLRISLLPLVWCHSQWLEPGTAWVESSDELWPLLGISTNLNDRRTSTQT